MSTKIGPSNVINTLLISHQAKQSHKLLTCSDPLHNSAFWVCHQAYPGPKMNFSYCKCMYIMSAMIELLKSSSSLQIPRLILTQR